MAASAESAAGRLATKVENELQYELKASELTFLTLLFESVFEEYAANGEVYGVDQTSGEGKLK